MKTFAMLLPSLLLAAIATAQAPQVQTAEDVLTNAVQTLDELDFGNQTPTTGGSGGGSGGGSNHHGDGHDRRGHHGRGRGERHRRGGNHGGGCHSGGCTRPMPSGVSNCRLPAVTDDCFIVSGRCLDLIDQVRFDCTALEEDGTIGAGSWSVREDGNALEVCPPQCLPAGCYEVSLWFRGCRVARFGVRLYEPTVPTIACDAELSVGETQCVYVHDGGVARPNGLYILVSPDNTPSVAPGIVELGLGNNFTNYLCGVRLDGPCAVECIGQVPPAIVGFNLYFQMVILNTTVPVLPLPTSGVCTTTYVQ